MATFFFREDLELAEKKKLGDSTIVESEAIITALDLEDKWAKEVE